VRDLPNEPGHQELVAQLQQPNVIATTVIGNTKAEKISAPPRVPKERVGFVDIPIDPDGRVRRNLLFASDAETTRASLSLQFALITTQHRAKSPGMV
jgi:adenylate cyclase